MPEPSLIGTGLARSFGSDETLTVAVRDVSLELYPGQLTLVIGPSGCGKSTLLAMVSGLLKPQAGRVLVRGQDLYQMSEAVRRDFRLRHFGFIARRFFRWE